MSDLFIPQKIKVGYQNRKDTYSGRLAYVIYFDNKGILRKEKSWQVWRDKNIKADEFENKPTSGFVLNKDIQRYNWSHFGSNRSYIRVFDPRGIEFEITPENLIGILTETNCSKRGLDGQFVYAWSGTELVLLPCGSEAYQEAVEYTKRQDQKVPAKALMQGGSYTTKKGEEVVYIGRYTWTSWNRYGDQGRVTKKKHIFFDVKNKKFFPKDDVAFLASQNSPHPVNNFASLVEDFQSDIHSSPTIKWETSPAKIDLSTKKMYPHDGDDRMILKKRNYYQCRDGVIVAYDVDIYHKFDNSGGKPRWTPNGYVFRNSLTMHPDMKMNYNHSHGLGMRMNGENMSEERLREELSKLQDLTMVLESGKRIPVRGWLPDLQDSGY